jgi:hypothetical protein
MEPVNKTNIKREEVGERDRALWARPRMDRNFPIKFKNGYDYPGFSGFCAVCNQRVANEDFRGDVLPQSPKMFLLSGISGCRKCKTLTRIEFRVYDDARVVLNQGGEWVTYQSVPTFSTKVLRLTKRVFSIIFWKM